MKDIFADLTRNVELLNQSIVNAREEIEKETGTISAAEAKRRGLTTTDLEYLSPVYFQDRKAPRYDVQEVQEYINRRKTKPKRSLTENR